jgi:hypothetical protein
MRVVSSLGKWILEELRELARLTMRLGNGHVLISSIEEVVWLSTHFLKFTEYIRVIFEKL